MIRGDVGGPACVSFANFLLPGRVPDHPRDVSVRTGAVHRRLCARTIQTVRGVTASTNRFD